MVQTIHLLNNERDKPPSLSVRKEQQRSGRTNTKTI